MVFDFLRRRRTDDPPSDAAQRAAGAVSAWSWLDDERRSQLVHDTDTLDRHLRWEAARDFELTDGRDIDDSLDLVAIALRPWRGLPNSSKAISGGCTCLPAR